MRPDSKPTGIEKENEIALSDNRKRERRRELG